MLKPRPRPRSRVHCDWLARGTHNDEAELPALDVRLEPSRSRAPGEERAVAARERHLAVRADIRRCPEVLARVEERVVDVQRVWGFVDHGCLQPSVVAAQLGGDVWEEVFLWWTRDGT